MCLSWFVCTGLSASKEVYINGMMNTELDAIAGADNIIGEGTEKQIWVNPTHGFISDALESAADLFGNKFGYSTGISQQMTELQQKAKDMGVKLDIHMHSQGHLVAKDGSDESHNYKSYGAPLFIKIIQNEFFISDDEVKGKIFKNDGDPVANPITAFFPSNWDKPGHGTENYTKAALARAAKAKAEQAKQENNDSK